MKLNPNKTIESVRRVQAISANKYYYRKKAEKLAAKLEAEKAIGIPKENHVQD